MRGAAVLGCPLGGDGWEGGRGKVCYRSRGVFFVLQKHVEGMPGRATDSAGMSVCGFIIR